MILTHDFSDNADYSRVSTEVVGGYGQLSLVDLPDQDFVEDFADDTDFTYDGAKSEFAAGKNQQKYQMPTNATCLATYTTDINLNYGNGTLAGSAVGGASISDGKLDLAHNDVRYVNYAADLNADSQQIGCIKFKVTPNYSGAPASDSWFFAISRAHNDIRNLIQLRHSNSGSYLRLHIYDQSGVLIAEHLCGSWNPTSGTEYEIEVNWDLTTGATRLFINGIQSGTTFTGTATRDSNITLFRIGNDYDGGAISNFKIADLIIFSTVQHVSNYTPGYTLQETKYIATNVTLPEMEDTQPGFIQALSNLVAVSQGTERYTLQIGRSGNYLYHNGTNWVTSNGTFAQASPIASFVTYASSLPVLGETYGQFKVHYPDSNTQGYVDTLTVTMTLEQYASSGIFETLNYFDAISIASLVGSITESGNNKIYFVMKTDNDYKYHNGSAWVTSDKSIGQSNTLTELGDNVASLLTENQRCKIYIILASEDGTETPKIDYITATYTFGGLEPVEGNMAQVYGYVKDLEENAIEGATVTIEVNIGANEYCETASKMRNKKVVKTTNDDGYFSAYLPWSSEFDSSGSITYKITVEKTDVISITEKDGEDIEFTIPDDTEYLNLTDRIEMAA